MLKNKMYIVSIICICLLVGCGNSNTDNITIEQNTSEIQDSITYDEYSGYWSYEGKTEEQILAEDDSSVNSSYDSSWTEEEIINAVNERSQYYKGSAYYSEIIDYWEDVREVRDISNVIEPLFETDKRYFI